MIRRLTTCLESLLTKKSNRWSAKLLTFFSCIKAVSFIIQADCTKENSMIKKYYIVLHNKTGNIEYEADDNSKIENINYPTSDSKRMTAKEMLKIDRSTCIHGSCFLIGFTGTQFYTGHKRRFHHSRQDLWSMKNNLVQAATYGLPRKLDTKNDNQQTFDMANLI